MNLAELVDRVGRANQYWERHRLEWCDQEWLKRRKKLLELTEEMDEQLAGRTIEEFGWAIAGDGQWYRQGEARPPRRPDDTAEFKAFSRAAAREKREEAQPELVGTDIGYTPFK